MRDDVIRILNAPEDIYNNLHDVAGIISDTEFEFIFSTSPAGGISNFEFYIAREFAFGRSDFNSINVGISQFTADVQNTYKSSTDAIVTSTGVPSHKVGPFGSGDLNPGNQRYLKRYLLHHQLKVLKLLLLLVRSVLVQMVFHSFHIKENLRKVWWIEINH